MLVPILFLFVSLSQIYTTTAKNEQFNLMMDFVYIIHDSAQCWKNEKGSEHVGYINFNYHVMAEQFHDYFKIGNDQVRVAVIGVKDRGQDDHRGKRYTWEILVPLTGVRSEWDAALKKNYEQWFIFHCDNDHARNRDNRDIDLVTAFGMAERIFEQSHGRVKAIFIASFPDPEGYDGSSVKAAQMQRDGVAIFLAFRVGWPTANLQDRLQEPMWTEANRLIDIVKPRMQKREDDVFIHDEVNQRGMFNWLKAEVPKHFCTYTMECFFQAHPQGKPKCLKGPYTPHTPEGMGDCSSMVDEPPWGNVCVENKLRNTSECTKTCDLMWPWIGLPHDCAARDACGGKIVAKRDGPRPYKILEHCPPEFRCPPCAPPQTNAPPTDRPKTKSTTEFDPEPGPGGGGRRIRGGDWVVIVFGVIGGVGLAGF